MKKKQFSINFQVIFLLNGRIIFVSGFQKESSDQKQQNDSNVRKLFIGKKFGIIGDAGYTFNKKDEKDKIIGFVPYKKPKSTKEIKGELTKEQKEYNRQLSQARAVAENTFAQIKKWEIFSGKFRHFSSSKNNVFDVNQIFRICCLLAQKKLQLTPLRKNDWKHPSYFEFFFGKKNFFIIYFFLGMMNLRNQILSQKVLNKNLGINIYIDVNLSINLFLIIGISLF